MPFVIATLLIALLCLWGLFKTLRDRNAPGILFSLAGFALFGWFSVMSIIEFFKNLLKQSV